MACPRQTYNTTVLVLILVYVMRTQVVNGMFGMENSSEACFGSAYNHCITNLLLCEEGRILVITNITYSGNRGIECHGVSDCQQAPQNKKCCEHEHDIENTNFTGFDELELYKACSGRQTCTKKVPDISVHAGRVTKRQLDFYCVDDPQIMEFCSSSTITDNSVHIMYNGSQNNYSDRLCRCRISGRSFALSSVDIRLQALNSLNSPRCTKSTIFWNYDDKGRNIQCRETYDHSSFRTLVNGISDTVVHLKIDENPTMAWIMAHGGPGNDNKVTVTCGFQTDTQEPEKETNVGAIVGPVVGIIVITVLAVTVLIFWRRRRANIRSPKNTNVRAPGNTSSVKAGLENGISVYDIISDNQLAKVDATPVGNTAKNGIPIAFNGPTRYTQMKSGEIENDYSDLNPLTIMKDDPSKHDSEYNHLHALETHGTNEGTNNVYSHLKANNTNNIRITDDYDHFDGGSPTAFEDADGQPLSFDDYDHISRPTINTGCIGALSYGLAQPITAGGQDTRDNTDYEHSSNTNNAVSYEMAYPLNSDKRITEKSTDYDHISGLSVSNDTNAQPISQEPDYDHLSRP